MMDSPVPQELDDRMIPLLQKNAPGLRGLFVAKRIVTKKSATAKTQMNIGGYTGEKRSPSIHLFSPKIPCTKIMIFRWPGPFSKWGVGSPLPLIQENPATNSIVSIARTLDSTPSAHSNRTAEGGSVPTPASIAVAHSSEADSGELKTGHRKM